MIITQKILITLHHSNYKHYEKLGYFIPRFPHKTHPKRLQIRKGTQIEVKVEDLPSKTSKAYIICKCDVCGKEVKIRYNLVNKNGNYVCKNCVFSSKEFKEKMSNKSYLKGKTGYLSPSYNSNLTDEERKHTRNTYNWKKEVHQKDNYTCQKCGYVGKKYDGILQAHHINNYKNFKELRNTIDNGITLCKDCHKSLHKEFGKFTNKKDLEKFLS